MAWPETTRVFLDGLLGGTGPTGATGPAGTATNTGATGPVGIGLTGAAGPTGANGAASTVTGPAGATGQTGAQGAPGSTGATGAPGNLGNVGPTGPAGAMGATGTFSPTNPAASVTDWYVNAASGSDTNSGQSAITAFATVEKLCQVLCPGATTFTPNQSVLVHIAAGSYGAILLDLNLSWNSAISFGIVCDYTSSAAITLSSVTNTVGSTTPTRGEIQTLSGTFVDKSRIRSTSGANVAAITYCTGLNGGATDAFVKTWFQESSLTAVNIASATTVAVDTLGVTISRLQVRFSGHPIAGRFSISDAILTGGVDMVNTVAGSAQIICSQCQIGGTTGEIARISGNCQFRNCRFTGTAGISALNLIQPVFWGCVFETSFSVLGSVNLANANCVNGGTWQLGGVISVGAAGLYLASTEWVNGISGTAIAMTVQSSLWVSAQQFGFGASWTNGVVMQAGSFALCGVASQMGIPCTTQLSMANHSSLTFSQIPIAYPSAQCAFDIAGDTGVPYGTGGATGPTGAAGAASTVTGPTGPAGGAGGTGPTGANGSSSTGPTGPIGSPSTVTGPTGPAGATGATGTSPVNATGAVAGDPAVYNGTVFGASATIGGGAGYVKTIIVNVDDDAGTISKLFDVQDVGTSVFTVEANPKSIRTLGGVLIHPASGAGFVSCDASPLTIAVVNGGGGNIEIAAGDNSSGAGGAVWAHCGNTSSGTQGNLVFGCSLPTDFHAMQGGIAVTPGAAAPTANPSTGTYFIYVDPADNKLKARGSSGTVTVLASP